MNPFRYHLRIFLLFGIVLFAIQPESVAQDGQVLMDRLKNKYASIDALRADFVQVTTSEYIDEDERFTGTLVLQGDKYRVETVGQTVVTDGVITWIYNEGDNQVLINDYVEDETTFSINEFFFKEDTPYEVTSAEAVTFSGESHYLLRLVPNTFDAYFQDVALWMRDRDTLITRLVVTDVNDIEMVFELTDIVLNPPVSNDLFLFVPPEGTEVVDLRS